MIDRNLLEFDSFIYRSVRGSILRFDWQFWQIWLTEVYPIWPEGGLVVVKLYYFTALSNHKPGILNNYIRIKNNWLYDVHTSHTITLHRV